MVRLSVRQSTLFTDAAGHYEFSYLAAGAYFVAVP